MTVFTEHTRKVRLTWQKLSVVTKQGWQWGRSQKVKSKHVNDKNTVYLDCGYDIIYTKIRGIFNLSQTQHFQSMEVLTVCEVSVHGWLAQCFGVLD